MRFIISLFLLTIFILFFIGGPDQHSPRSFQAFWNLGHILFFSLFSLFFLSFKRISNSYPIQCILAFVLTMIVGVAVEFIQHGFHQRQLDSGDLFRNIIGVMVCIFYLLPSRKTISKKMLLSMQSITVTLFAFQIFPVIIALSDEYIARNQFPLLSGFETPFEIKRWSAETDLLIDESIKQTGKASLRVSLNTNTYSGVELRYFPRNWAPYNFLQFSVYNPSSEDMLIVCRIHDDERVQNGIRYEDRFKRRYLIPQGWHRINVSLKDVENAPKNRKMNMQRIMNVRFFTIRLPYPRIIHIDDVRLF